MTKTEWLYSASEAVAKCNELERENEKLRQQNQQMLKALEWACRQFRCSGGIVICQSCPIHKAVGAVALLNKKGE